MKGWRAWALVLGAWMWFSGVAHADPENFMLHDFVFERPTAWQWVETTSDLPRFQMRLTVATNDVGVVEFYLYPKGDPHSDLASVLSRWTKSFIEPEERLHLTQDKMVIQDQKAVRFQMQGTYAYYSRSLKTQRRLAGYTIIGFFIPHDKGNIVALLRGSKKLTDASKVEFRHVVEKGLAKE